MCGTLTRWPSRRSTASSLRGCDADHLIIVEPPRRHERSGCARWRVLGVLMRRGGARPNFVPCTRTTIIVAGGSGKRMGARCPSSSKLLKGRRCCVDHRGLPSFDPSMPIIVRAAGSADPIWKALCMGHRFLLEHQVVAGGEERFHSVKERARKVKGDGLVAVHDGVRPLGEQGTDHALFRSRRMNMVRRSPWCPSARACARPLPEGQSRHRPKLRAVQTPQCFHTALLAQGLRAALRSRLHR
jgi:2-C-methyl-D-erythritol 4-phosphate cytidylyltransferase